MAKIELPSSRNLPSGHLKARRDHLVEEVRREVASRRRQLPRCYSIIISRRLILTGAVLIVVGASALLSLGRMDSGTQLAAAAVPANISSLEAGALKSRERITTNVVLAMQAREQNDNVAIVGGNADQQTLLREILSRMPNNSLTQVAITPTTYMGKDGVGLEFTTLPGDAARSQWEEMLLAGAFRDLSAARGLTPVVGYPDQAPGYYPTALSSEEIEATIRDAAADADAELVQMQVYTPDGIAPTVILQVDDAAAFLKYRAARFLIAIGNPELHYEGTYIEVIDNNGAFVWESGSNSLVSSNSVGIRPDLSGCNPIQNNAEFRTKPCPVS